MKYFGERFRRHNEFPNYEYHVLDIDIWNVTDVP